MIAAALLAQVNAVQVLSAETQAGGDYVWPVLARSRWHNQPLLTCCTASGRAAAKTAVI